MDASNIALGGMQQAEQKLERAAARVASAGELSPAALPGDSVTLSDSMAAVLTARQEFAANLNAFKTADEMQRQTIDLLA